ncbi:copper amine oxidase N-terminal domain-containing protein [Anaerotignum faecicola]
MKKFLSMVLAAAMVISTVPATAFALDAKATAKVVSSLDLTETDAAKVEENSTVTGHSYIGGSFKAPEIQLKVTDASYTEADKKTAPTTKFTVSLDNAKFVNKTTGAVVTADSTDQKANFAITVVDDTPLTDGTSSAVIQKPEVTNVKVNDKDEIEVTVSGILEKDDIIKVVLNSVLTKTSAGTKATVTVDSDDLDLSTDALTYATVQDTGIKATLKKVAEVAEEETTDLEKDLKIETAAGDFVIGQKFEIKVSSGFELRKGTVPSGADYTITKGDDDNKLNVEITKDGAAGDKYGDTLTIDAAAIIVDAATAKAGAVAKLTVKALKDGTNTFKATADAVEAAKVVDQTVTLSVDEDEDVPVIYSGVDVDNDGITDDSDHKSLEITLKESAKSALDVKKAFTLGLPEGVYVTDVQLKKTEGAYTTLSTPVTKDDFVKAYKKGEYDGFEFARKTFVDTDDLSDDMELSFKLELVAEPNFEGDVKLTLSGDAFDKKQEVTIAKFVKPYTVEASQNDMIIDYRNTKVPTNIVVKEAEEGLWRKGLSFTFGIDKFKDKDFENDATYKVDDKSDMEIKEAKTGLGFKVDDESNGAAAAVTISDISLYMSRSIAAGAYNLELITNANIDMYAEELVALSSDPRGTAIDTIDDAFKTYGSGAGVTAVPTKYTVADDKDFVNKTVLDIDSVDKATVKEGFVNVITAGRDQDDASFTKKVVVPVGEKYLIAGEEQVVLDVPAYISAQGYTMLPVRAVATALGINNNNVLWNQASRTVTILYGQRIITMVAGQKVITVNGNTIPASATVQIKDGRTFLPMRDLATALNVADITWDAATKTATMNGNQNK